MKKVSILFVIMIILVLPCYAFEVNLTPNEVESGETFYLSLNLGENTYLTNGHLKYDSKLFEFISCDTPNVELQVLQDGELAWFYTELQESPLGIRKIDFKFKATRVLQDTIGNFVIEDGIYINNSDKVNENLDFTHPIKIKEEMILVLPATGGIGLAVVTIIILEVIVIPKIKKRR